MWNTKEKSNNGKASLLGKTHRKELLLPKLSYKFNAILVTIPTEHTGQFQNYIENLAGIHEKISAI